MNPRELSASDLDQVAKAFQRKQFYGYGQLAGDILARFVATNRRQARLLRRTARSACCVMEDGFRVVFRKRRAPLVMRVVNGEAVCAVDSPRQLTLWDLPEVRVDAELVVVPEENNS